MDSINLTGKTKQLLTPSLNSPSTKRSRDHEAENEANHYVMPDNVKFRQQSALSDLTNVSQTQQMSLPHNSLFVPNYFYPANHYVTPDNVKFSQRSALSDLTNVSQTQQISLPHNSLFVPNYFYPRYQTHMPSHIGFTPLVLSSGML
ncbi:uncharacterized protein G2W53_028829 [Senna tora]|uniref:Uncharacterized protein n=1 Tax=Senna tora TaxID=362788 RepID=A0A834T4S4_9FABA|nr:uncharacterized protein G2W53_028829 [Senna tora]